MALAVTFRYGKREYYKELSEGEELSFGCHKKDTIQIPELKAHMLFLRATADEVYAVAEAPFYLPSRMLPCNELIVLSGTVEAAVYITRVIRRGSKSVNLPYHGRITVGRRKDNDIMVSYPIISGNHFQLLMEAGRVHAEDLNSTNGLYLNGKKISKATVRSGDVLSVFSFLFVIENGRLYFENIGSSIRVSDKISGVDQSAEPEAAGQRAVKSKGIEKEKVRTGQQGGKMGKAYLQYQLSPRIREQLPHEPIVLSGAPGHGTSVGSRRSNFAYLISSGAMMAASLATGMLTPGALLMRAAGMISPVANMAMYSKMTKEEKKQLEEYEKMRKERYQAYIDTQKARIHKVAEVQRRILTQENPEPSVWMDSVRLLKRNLWERMASDSDFLSVRLGIGKDKLCVEVKSRADVDGFSMVDDELEELAGQIIEETRYVENVPVRVSMKKQQTIGMVGSREAVFYLLRNILIEITAAHSGKDVHIVGIFDQKSRKYWKELRWLPHIWDESGQVRYIAFDEARRHTVCELLADVIRRRKSSVHSERGREEQQVLPHYIILAEHENLLMAESIYEALVSNDPILGMTTVFLAESMYELPQTCQYIIDLTDKPYAFEREEYDERLYFKTDARIHSAELESFTRRMAAIEVKNQMAEAGIPSGITFLQGYGVNRAEDLDVLNRWEHSEPYRTLEAPIGMMEGKKVFSLNILDGDQAHGPHGLLAGTTGSGKSELLQTWILSMAVSYHPHDVNFVIIDYKGGGMSDLMEPLPHVTGKITNIDRNITRSLISLKSELKRRQRLFVECGVNNIAKYQKAYKSGLAKAPLPHLIIVTDEFAEMKKEEPEFMAELNSVAAIGRTLGVHLVLATQKPAGVVTDQISANSRFRICMKVQDVADSREMLKHPDAARITQAGRAYVRVGEDEVFELFQSFYSAAEYGDKTMADKRKVENRVHIVGVTGNRINPVPRKKKTSSELDELTAVINYINELCSRQGIQKMAGPWLPELPRWLTFEQLELPDVFNGKTWGEERTDLKIPVGRYDIPALQKQGVIYLDFMSTGHFGIYGMPASGKTFMLKTILTSLGMCYTPKVVHITIIDAGNWSLQEFEKMPHVREVILNQEEEKIRKFEKRICIEMESRKNAFLTHAVSSLSAYREAVNSDTPAIVIVVDQIKPLFEQYPEMDEVMNRIASSGAAYGIYLVFTANTGIGLSYKFTQLIKGAIALQQPEKGDYTQLVGSVNGVSRPDFPGRALMRGEPPVAFQTAVYADAGKDQDRHEKVMELLKKMADAWNVEEAGLSKADGAKPQQTVSEQADGQQVLQGEKAQLPYSRRTVIPVGIYRDDKEQAEIDLSINYYCLVCSEGSQKSREFMDRIKETLYQKPDNQVICLGKDNYKEEMEKIIGNLNDRQKIRNKRREENEFDGQEWLHSYMQICILIADLPGLTEALTLEEQMKLRRIFTKSAGLGVIILVAGMRKELQDASQNLVVSKALNASCIVIVEGNPLESTIFQYENVPIHADTLLDEGEAALIQNGQIRFIRYYEKGKA